LSQIPLLTFVNQYDDDCTGVVDNFCMLLYELCFLANVGLHFANYHHWFQTATLLFEIGVVLALICV
jgi:hypothetical protein